MENERKTGKNAEKKDEKSNKMKKKKDGNREKREKEIIFVRQPTPKTPEESAQEKKASYQHYIVQEKGSLSGL